MAESKLSPLGILRRGDVLVRLVAHLSESGELALSREQLLDVAEVRAIVEAWGRLSAVTTITAGTIADLSLIAEATTADPMGDVEVLPALDAAPAEPRPKPTAAHPRAFQGTKYQPPKMPGGKATDLRRFLQSKLGFEALARHVQSVDGDFGVPDEAWELPAPLRLAGGASLRGLSAADRGRLGVLWRGLNAGAHDDAGKPAELGARLAVVCFDAGANGGLAYLDALSRVSPILHVPVARGLFGAARRARLHSELIAVLSEFDRAADGMGDPIITSDRWGEGQEPTEQEREAMRMERLASRAEHWAESFGHCEPKHFPWMLEGVRLTARFGWEGADWADPVLPVDPKHAAAVAAIVEACGDAVDDYAWDFWHTVAFWGEGGAAADALADAAPLPDDSEQAGFSRFCTRVFAYVFELGAQESRVEELGGFVLSWVKAFTTLEPRWWLRAAHLMDDLLGTAECPLDRVLEAVERVCREPFSDETTWGWVVTELALADCEVWESLLAAPDESWLTMAGFLGWNEFHLLGTGVRVLMANEAAWATRLFANAPRAFCNLAKTLGLLSEAEGRLVLREARKEALLVDLPHLGVASVVNRVDGLKLPPGVAQVPKRLRLHLSGERQLSENQLARDESLLRDRWGECVAWSMKGRIERRLAKRFQVAFPDAGPGAFALTEAWSHALLFQVKLDSNRRSLRRLLRAIAQGDTDYLARHPENAEWLKELGSDTSEATVRAWKQPPELVLEVEGLGEVRFAVELDPLEALRMGTYVGSCFGLGGSFAYGAAAVVLDANMHVLYARAKDGRFLARQILGIRSDDYGAYGLQCNDVYPRPSPALAAAFRAYDEALSTALDLPFDRGGDFDRLIAEDIYDDGEWDDAPES